MVGRAGQPGHHHDGQEAGQHGEAPEGEALSGVLVVQRETDERRKAEEGLATEHAQREGDEEADETAVRVGAGHEEHAGELWEEYDVHQVGAHDVQAVDALHGDGDGGAEDAHDDDTDAQHPQQLPVGRLWHGEGKGSIP